MTGFQCASCFGTDGEFCGPMLVCQDCGEAYELKDDRPRKLPTIGDLRAYVAGMHRDAPPALSIGSRVRVKNTERMRGTVVSQSKSLWLVAFDNSLNRTYWRAEELALLGD